MSETRDQLLHAIFTTAIEGGINYWARTLEYHWENQDDEHRGTDDLHGFYAVIIDAEGGNVFGPPDSGQHRIDRDVIEKGYRLATGSWIDRIRWSAEYPPAFTNPEPDWDFDAGDADAIVQLGLFDDVTYG